LQAEALHGLQGIWGLIKMKKITFALFGILLMVSIITSVYVVYAVNADYCCEKTSYGAWCQNAPDEKCDSNFRKAPTSCDATSYCKEGCCYDSQEGLCMENTPQRVCDEYKGSWSENAECDIPQCELGCCIIDDQAAYVTLTRCKRISGFYGVDSDFRMGIGNEVDCIALAGLRDKGACVYEEEYVRTCKFTTRENCNNIMAANSSTEQGFHEGYLCSADSLATDCARSTKTTCLEGKDEVYFMDTCGNPANIYDASKADDPIYWNKIITKEESCEAGKGNANSKTCGNCDYFLGSLCKDAERGNAPQYGDNICGDLNCYGTSDGKDHKHGESWCSYDGNTGNGSDPVGSRHVRHICVNGEEITEPCEDQRAKICIESVTNTGAGDFTEAACVVNRWQDCVQQTEEEDCKNIDKRDCYWMAGSSFTRTAEGISGVTPGGGLCVPDVPPGLNFWEEGDSQGICAIGNAQCTVYYEEGLFGGKKCIENCECLEDSWAEQMNVVCTSVGDCGGYTNWVGKYSDDGYSWKVDNKKETLSKGIIDSLKKKAGV
jgi:hypothetical protein